MAAACFHFPVPVPEGCQLPAHLVEAAEKVEAIIVTAIAGSDIAPVPPRLAAQRFRVLEI